MPHELIDETSGPGRPASSSLALQEIWAALGYDDGRAPTLDEVLIEVRDLRQRETGQVQAAALPPFPEDAEGDPVEFVPQSALSQPSVSYGAFGMTIVGYTADEVIQIRQAHLAERKDKS